MDQYFTTDNGEQSGPYDEDVLIDWIKKGELDRNTFCWKEGMQEWKPLHEVIKLSSVPPPPPSEPPPPPPSQEIPSDHYKERNIPGLMIFWLITLSIYWIVYIVPSYTRDMEVITGKKRIEFATAVVLGIFTLGLFSELLVIKYLWELGQREKEIDPEYWFAPLQVAGAFILSWFLALGIPDIGVWLSLIPSAFIVYQTQCVFNDRFFKIYDRQRSDTIRMD